MISTLWELHEVVLMLNPPLSVEDVQREQSIHDANLVTNKARVVISPAILNGHRWHAPSKALTAER